MFLSILFVVFVIGTVAGMVLYPKSETAVSGVKCVVVSSAVLTCYLALAAWIGRLLLKHVGLGVPFVALLVLFAVTWGGIYRKKKVQRMNWKIWEIAGVLLAVIVVCAISFHVFTPALSVRYSNAIGAEQFLAAVELLRGGEVAETLSFQAYVEALFVGTAAPFLTMAQWYKAFIAAEIFMHILEAALFCTIVYTMSDKKLVRYGAPVLCFFYFLGYPALSLLWANYEYWSGNAVLLLLGVYLFLELEMRERTKGNEKAKAMIAVAVLAAAVLTVALFYQPFFAGGHGTQISELKAEGMYRCMYGDLLFFLPAFLFVFVFVFFRRKRLASVGIISVVMLVEALALYMLWSNAKLDTYYYFLNYYNLWTIGWVLAAAALAIAADAKQLPIYFSYVGLLAALGLLTWTDYDGFMYERNPYYNQPGITRNYFALYRQTAEALRLDYETYAVPDEVLEAMVSVAEDESIAVSAVLTEDEALLYWHEAFTKQPGEAYWLEKEEFLDVVRNLTAADVDAIVVRKDSEEYSKYREYFKQCTVVHEDAKAAIYAPNGENWNDLAGMQMELAQEKQELFSYIKENIDEKVPLLAEQDAYMDFIMYDNIVGYSGEDFYTWHYTPLGNVENLNEHGIHYVVLLYGEQYYEDARYYFDRFEVIYENAAGKIIRCDGEEWTTQY